MERSLEPVEDTGKYEAFKSVAYIDTLPHLEAVRLTTLWNVPTASVNAYLHVPVADGEAPDVKAHSTFSTPVGMRAGLLPSDGYCLAELVVLAVGMPDVSWCIELTNQLALCNSRTPTALSRWEELAKLSKPQRCRRGLLHDLELYANLQLFRPVPAAMFQDATTVDDEALRILAWNASVPQCRQLSKYLTAERITDFLNYVARNGDVELFFEALVRPQKKRAVSVERRKSIAARKPKSSASTFLAPSSPLITMAKEVVGVDSPSSTSPQSPAIVDAQSPTEPRQTLSRSSSPVSNMWRTGSYNYTDFNSAQFERQGTTSSGRSGKKTTEPSVVASETDTKVLRPSTSNCWHTAGALLAPLYKPTTKDILRWMSTASINGHSKLLSLLLTVYGIPSLPNAKEGLLMDAAESGAVHLLSWLHSIFPHVPLHSCQPLALSLRRVTLATTAAQNGHVRVLDWLKCRMEIDVMSAIPRTPGLRSGPPTTFLPFPTRNSTGQPILDPNERHPPASVLVPRSTVLFMLPHFAAARANQVVVLEWMYRSNLDLGMRDENNRGMEHYAAEAGALEALNWMLSKGIDIMGERSRCSSAQRSPTCGTVPPPTPRPEEVVRSVKSLLLSQTKRSWSGTYVPKLSGPFETTTPSNVEETASVVVVPIKTNFEAWQWLERKQSIIIHQQVASLERRNSRAVLTAGGSYSSHHINNDSLADLALLSSAMSGESNEDHITIIPK